MARLGPLKPAFQRGQLFRSVQIHEERRYISEIGLCAAQTGLPFLHLVPTLCQIGRQICTDLAPHEADGVLPRASDGGYDQIVVVGIQCGQEARHQVIW